MRILVVEDDAATRLSLDRALRQDGHEVALVADGAEALRRQAARPADAVILDLGLPDLDGVEVCRRLRKGGDRTPVLMLTARDTVRHRVAGLDAGADDYLVKPFALAELRARMRALLRRSVPTTEEKSPGVLRFEHLSLDRGTFEARSGGRQLDLTRTEFSLLELLLSNPRQVLTRSVIFERVWGYDFGPSSNSLEVYIGYLRRKTESDGEPRLIHTVRGVGYVLRAQ